ncbi:MAG: hypothetical protein ABIR48_08490 [Gammaproteobacteria bacterium]
MDKKLLTALTLTLASGVALATDTGINSSTNTTGSASVNTQASVSFDSLDTNKDGALSQAEYNASLNVNTGTRVQGAATTNADPNDPLLRTPLEKHGIQTTPEAPTSLAPAGDLPDKVMDQTDPTMLQGGQGGNARIGGSSAPDSSSGNSSMGTNNPSSSTAAPARDSSTPAVGGASQSGSASQ